MASLLALQDEIALERNLPYVGKRVRVLVESVSKKGGTYSARTDTGKLVHFASDTPCIGEYVNVKIIKAGAYELLAEEIK